MVFVGNENNRSLEGPCVLPPRAVTSYVYFLFFVGGGGGGGFGTR